MLNADEEETLNVLSVVLWQVMVVLIVSVASKLFLSKGFDVFYGGFTVVLSTWHVYYTVSKYADNKATLLKFAGLRFAIFIVVLALGIFFLSLQPFYLIIGMFAAYVAMYIRSLVFIFLKMKGDNLG